MTPFFSIVIPVYNVGPWLRECLDSVRAQTFAEWECVCVDDGSTDDSGDVLEEYAGTDSRFRVVHQRNAGVSAARNVALSLMTGEAFLFLDGDDAITPDALDSFKAAFRETGADALLCHPVVGQTVSGNLRRASVKTIVRGIESRPVQLLVGPFGTLGYPFSRIYRTGKFGHVRFAEGVAMCEDNRYWADALCVPANWAILDDPYYVYRDNRSGSETSNRSFRHRWEHLDCYRYVLESMTGQMGASRSEIAAFCRKYRNEIGVALFDAFAIWPRLSEDERRKLLLTVAELRSKSRVTPIPHAASLMASGCRAGLSRVAIPISKRLWRMEQNSRRKRNPGVEV